MLSPAERHTHRHLQEPLLAVATEVEAQRGADRHRKPKLRGD